jgi:mRNA-degrading endonuclease YafQ of YafQ-DinJ toxin-antitoxin module
MNWTRQFKRDYKKLQSGPRYRSELETVLPAVLDKLVVDHAKRCPGYWASRLEP